MSSQYIAAFCLSLFTLLVRRSRVFLHLFHEFERVDPWQLVSRRVQVSLDTDVGKGGGSSVSLGVGLEGPQLVDGRLHGGDGGADGVFEGDPQPDHPVGRGFVGWVRGDVARHEVGQVAVDESVVHALLDVSGVRLVVGDPFQDPGQRVTDVVSPGSLE